MSIPFLSPRRNLQSHNSPQAHSFTTKARIQECIDQFFLQSSRRKYLKNLTQFHMYFSLVKVFQNSFNVVSILLGILHKITTRNWLNLQQTYSFSKVKASSYILMHHASIFRSSKLRSLYRQMYTTSLI